MNRKAGSAAIALWLLMAAAAGAQEFCAPASWDERSATDLLERGLPGARPGWEAAALAIRWHGMPELETRAVLAGFGWRSARAAVGYAQSGTSDLGWEAAAVALGWVEHRAGAGVRACARAARDQTGAEPSRAGLEVGAGAWMRASERLVLTAAAPQLHVAGEAPPLERRLEVGAVLELPGARLWLARAAAPAASGSRAEHAGGAAFEIGPATVWAALRDHPFRGGFGIAASAGWVRVAAAAESHPVLRETVRLLVAVGGER